MKRKRIKILLWEMGEDFGFIVLWDGQNTYWHDGMIPSPDHKNIKYGEINSLINSRYTYIGIL